MNINQFIRLAANIIGEKAPHRSLTNTQITRLVNAASLKLLRKKIGLPETYQPGLPMPPEVTEMSRKNKEDIRVFLVELGIKDNPSLHISSQGFADIPTDLYYCSTLEYWRQIIGVPRKVKPIEILTDTQYQDRLSSEIIYPTLSHPICNFQKDYIRFEPKNMSYAHMIYYRYPRECVYAIKYENDMPVYDPDNSVDLEWNEDNQLLVLLIFLGDIGISIEKQEILQYAEMHKKSGV